jgi:multidrug efflux pump subunit AcrB
MTAQNVTVPSGLAKFGSKQYVIRLNSTPEAVATLNQVPIKVVNGSPILIRDVAYVRDGGPPQQNIVRQDGVRGVLLTILNSLG